MNEVAGLGGRHDRRLVCWKMRGRECMEYLYLCLYLKEDRNKALVYLVF